MKASANQRFTWLFTTEHVSAARAKLLLAATELRASVVGKNADGLSIVRLLQRFLAFDTAAEAAAYQIAFLRENYPAAWQQILAADPEGFATALKRPGNRKGLSYYSGREEDYRAQTRHFFDVFSLRVLGFGHSADEVKLYQVARLAPDDVVGRIGPKTRAALLEDLRSMPC